MSQEQLGEGLGIAQPRISIILKKVGLKAMYEKRRISQEKKEAIRRGYNVDMNVRDIAYFLNVPHDVVYHDFSQIGKRSRIQRFVVSIFGKHLTYPRASQIYEAQDLDFGIEEITELLEIDEELVNYAISNRISIESKIIEALKTLYPSE